MKLSVSLTFLLWTLASGTAVPAAAESLNYSINWSSGVSVGEGTLSSTKSSDPARPGWNFDLDFNASVPGFVVRDHYRSSANLDLCSTRLDKEVVRGSRKTKETVTFDREKHEAQRQTQGGGQSEFATGLCARDALAFVEFVRKELEQGRMAPQQTVILGAQYEIHLEYAGVQSIQIGKTKTEAERIQTSITGPGSGLTLELFFARDAARTPLLARIPLAAGTLNVELVR